MQVGSFVKPNVICRNAKREACNCNNNRVLLCPIFDCTFCSHSLLALRVQVLFVIFLCALSDIFWVNLGKDVFEVLFFNL